MPHHFIDAPDNDLLTTNEMVSREDLSSMYPTVYKEALSPWMKEDERQKALQTQRDTQVASLRRHAALIGLFISVPYIAGILLIQVATIFYATYTKETALFFFFVNMFLLAGYSIGAVALFKRVSQIFHDHTLKASPIILAILACLLLVSQPLVTLANHLIGGVVGYGVHLVSLLIISILLSVVLVFVWTSPKVAPLLKLAMLLTSLAVSATVYFLFA